MSRVQSRDEIVIDYEQPPDELSNEQVAALLEAGCNLGGEFGTLLTELVQSDSSDGES